MKPVPAPGPRSGERGIALVMAIVILLVVIILASMVMQTLSTQRKISGHGMLASRAMSLAEAGLAEATSRLRSGGIALNERVPGSAAQIFLVGSGGQPTLGADSTAYATLQPAGDWLAYTTAYRSPDALTIRWRRDPVSGAILRYDVTQDPPLNTALGMPVVQVSVSGLAGNDRARLASEIIWTPVHCTLNAALTSGVAVTLTGGAALCGYQHRPSLTPGDGEYGRSGSPSCSGDEVGTANVPGVWSAGTVNSGGGLVSGSPSAYLESQSGFYDGPWEALGVTQSKFDSLAGTAVGAVTSGVSHVVWLDNNTTKSDRSGSFSVDALSGNGVLYVDGDLTLTGHAAFQGLLYVEGNLASTASGSILGGVVVRGRTAGSCSLAGGPAILYSRDTVNEAVAASIGDMTTIAWRQVR